MPDFTCSICSAPFEVPQAALDKYPGWTPRYCRTCSPKKQGDKSGRGGGQRATSRRRGGGASREEDLTRAEVLAKYTGGPQDGVFTDGSSIPNPGPGGWGVVWVEAGEVRAERHGHDPDTTNNRMELRALIEAFTLLPTGAEVTVYTDSRLCVDTITKWAAGWEARGWKRKAGPIANLDLVQELWGLAQAHPGCRLQWIEAHSGHRWNEYADALSTAWRRETV